jgi:hypothetical protein
MLKKIIVFLLVLAAVLALIIATQPSEFRVKRSAVMAAPSQVIFAQVNDLHKWEAWSPWAKLDPNAKSSYEGPEAGVGAVMSWDGNNDVGAGSMKITDSKQNEAVTYQLDFLKPMKGTDIAEITLQAEGENTLVTWNMSGTNNFIGKAVGLVFNCEKMVGDQFDKGLANIKGIVEVR